MTHKMLFGDPTMWNLITLSNIYIVPDNIPSHMRYEKLKQSLNDVLFGYAVVSC